MGENSQDEEILDHITFILANVTTFCEDARILLSENQELIENCTSLVDLYQQQSSVSAKLIRLIANLATIQNVSEGLINNVAFIEVLMEFLQSNDNCELQVNAISCLTNILFYDNGSNVQSELRQKLCLCITPFMLHVQELDICIEAVRGICNLSRYQQTLPIFEKLHTVDGLLCLLQAENQVLIYFCIGALINLSSLVKNSSATTLCYKTILKVLEFLEEGDFIPQIVQQACRLLLNIGIEEMSEGYKNRIREFLLIIPEAPEELQILLDQLPVTHLCPHEGCGRRFKDQETLENHLSRRHNQLCIL